MAETLFERRAAAQDHYHRGLELKRQGFLLEAEQEFRKSIEADPCYFDPVLELLVEQEEGGSEDLRTEHLLRRADQKYKLGIALLKHGRGEKAVRHLRAACELEKENSKYHCGLAKALIACGLEGEAMDVLRRAARFLGGSDPVEHRALANLMLGKLHIKADHKHRARRRLLLACSLGIDNEEIARLLKKLGIGSLRRAFLISRMRRQEAGAGEDRNVRREPVELLLTHDGGE